MIRQLGQPSNAQSSVIDAASWSCSIFLPELVSRVRKRTLTFRAHCFHCALPLCVPFMDLGCGFCLRGQDWVNTCAKAPPLSLNPKSQPQQSRCHCAQSEPPNKTDVYDHHTVVKHLTVSHLIRRKEHQKKNKTKQNKKNTEQLQNRRPRSRQKFSTVVCQENNLLWEICVPFWKLWVTWTLTFSETDHQKVNALLACHFVFMHFAAVSLSSLSVMNFCIQSTHCHFSDNYCKTKSLIISPHFLWSQNQRKKWLWRWQLFNLILQYVKLHRQKIWLWHHRQIANTPRRTGSNTSETFGTVWIESLIKEVKVPVSTGECWATLLDCQKMSKNLAKKREYLCFRLFLSVLFFLSSLSLSLQRESNVRDCKLCSMHRSHKTLSSEPKKFPVNQTETDLLCKNLGAAQSA